MKKTKSFVIGLQIKAGKTGKETNARRKPPRHVTHIEFGHKLVAVEVSANNPATKMWPLPAFSSKWRRG